MKITWQKVKYEESRTKEMTKKIRTNDWKNIVRRMFRRLREAAEDIGCDIDYCQEQW